MADFDTTPYWQTSVTLPRFRSLDRDLHVDVAIVGGGITGITAAYLLKKAGKSVALLERHRCLRADTGHTTAHLTCVTDTRLSELVKSFGADHARAAWDAGLAAIAQIDGIVRTEGIECGFAWVPGYLHAPPRQPADASEQEAATLRDEANQIAELGFDARYLDRVPFMNMPGIEILGQARFNPRQYLAALLARIHGGGSHVLEDTNVDEVKAGDADEPLSLISNVDTITCDYVIIATHNPIVGLASLLSASMLQTKLALYSSYAVAGRVPSGSIPDALFWDTSDPYNYLRIERRPGGAGGQRRRSDLWRRRSQDRSSRRYARVLRLGVRRAARRPRARAGGAGGRGGGLAARAARRAVRPPDLHPARRAGLGRGVPLVPPAGGGGAGLPHRVAARPGAQRDRGRRDAALARQRGPRGGPRWQVRHGLGRRVERAAAGRGAGHRHPGRHHRRADPGVRGGRLPGRLDALHRCLRRDRAGRARAPGPRHAVAHEVATDHRPASVLPPDPDPSPPRPATPVTTVANDLSDVPLLAALPPGARRQLEDAARLLPVAAGTWLMREGEPAGSAYVVRGGRLEVTIGDRVVRELGPGEVLGELALLTGAPRSASVRARRDSVVLEVPREAFERAITDDSAAARFVLRQVADRLRTAGEPPVPPRATPPSVVAVVGLQRGVAVAEVAEHLTRRLAQHLRVVRLDAVDTDGLDRAERAHDRVVLVAEHDEGGAGLRWRDFCLREADVVVLVSDAAADPRMVVPAPASRPELVLVGGPLLPARRADWAVTVDAWQVTVVDGDLATGLRPLADRLAGRSLGLVLAGGGARAFAHIGVLRELEESGLHVDRVAGTSIGSIIAAVHATGRSGAELEDVCYGEVGPSQALQRLAAAHPLPVQGTAGA